MVDQPVVVLTGMPIALKLRSLFYLQRDKVINLSKEYKSTQFQNRSRHDVFLFYSEQFVFRFLSELLSFKLEIELKMNLYKKPKNSNQPKQLLSTDTLKRFMKKNVANV